MRTKTITTTTMKIVIEQRKEKKREYFLPGQKYDPPEDVWNANYLTLKSL